MKIVLAISQRHIGQFMQIRNRAEESQADIGHLTKVAIFANSRWWRAAILKIALSQSELSDFEQIWYADANFHSEDGYLTKKI